MDKSSEPMTFSIVIMGSRASGKNTFIKTVSEIEVMNPIKENTDPNLHILGINMDFGRVTSEDNKAVLYLFGLRLVRRFDFMLDALSAPLLGFTLMVDSRHPEIFLETRSIFQTLTAYRPLPIVIAANYADHPDAWDVDALRTALQVPNDIPIIPCNAKNRDSVKAVIIALMEEVLKDIAASDEDQVGEGNPGDNQLSL